MKIKYKPTIIVQCSRLKFLVTEHGYKNSWTSVSFQLKFIDFQTIQIHLGSLSGQRLLGVIKVQTVV